MEGAVFRSAAVLVLAVVFVLILVAVLVLILVAVLILVLVAVLIFVLVIHNRSSKDVVGGTAASIDCPIYQDLSLSLKIRLTRSPAKMAAAMPPAQAFKPPVKMPRNPSSCTASFTPFARL